METHSALRVGGGASSAPGFSALGMALTNPPERPDARALRCVPKRWTQIGDGAEAGVGKRRRRRSRGERLDRQRVGVAHVVLGHDSPSTGLLRADALGADAPRGRLSAETERQKQKRRRERLSNGGGDERRRRDERRFRRAREQREPSSRLGRASGCTRSTSGDYAPPLRGRAAMFESVAEERRKERALKDAREREAREREERRRVAALGASSGSDIFARSWTDLAKPIVFQRRLGSGGSHSAGRGRGDKAAIRLRAMRIANSPLGGRAMPGPSRAWTCSRARPRRDATPTRCRRAGSPGRWRAGCG